VVGHAPDDSCGGSIATFPARVAML
jgi:hypothetical protein